MEGRITLRNVRRTGGNTIEADASGRMSALHDGEPEHVFLQDSPVVITLTEQTPPADPPAPRSAPDPRLSRPQ